MLPNDDNSFNLQGLRALEDSNHSFVAGLVVVVEVRVQGLGLNTVDDNINPA